MGSRSWSLRLAVAVLVAAAVLPAPVAGQEAAGTSSDEAAVVAAASRVLDAINAGDTAMARASLLPDAVLRPTSPPGLGGPLPEPMDVEAFVAMLAEAPPGTFTERLFDPEVRVQAGVAHVWAPYDFYIDGTFSHCGVDAFQLVKTEEGWKVASLSWTGLQPPACEKHPEGPPGGGER